MTSTMCNSKWYFRIHKNTLWCNTTCMKDRNFVVVDIYRFTPFWFINISNPNSWCWPNSNWTAMCVCIFGSNFNLYKLRTTTTKTTTKIWNISSYEWVIVVLYYNNTSRSVYVYILQYESLHICSLLYLHVLKFVMLVSVSY